MKKINIYIIARIDKDAHTWIDGVCDKLDKNIFDIFSPKDHNPWNEKHEFFSKQVFDTDLVAIEKSDIGLMLPEYGCDCSWEAGWYASRKKPVVVFVNDQAKWLKDWMVKGGVDYVITNNQKTLAILQKDPILKYKKIISIENIAELNHLLRAIHEKQSME